MEIHLVSSLTPDDESRLAPAMLVAIGRILDLARWAPSGDNTQPWRFRLTDDRHFTLIGNDTRDRSNLASRNPRHPRPLLSAPRRGARLRRHGRAADLDGRAHAGPGFRIRSSPPANIGSKSSKRIALSVGGQNWPARMAATTSRALARADS